MMRPPSIAVALLVLLTLAPSARGNFCALPQSAVSGAGMLVQSRPASVLKVGAVPTIASVQVSVGLMGGVATSSRVVVSFGLQHAARGAFSCFLSTETPLAVAALPGTDSIKRLVPSPARTMTLEWTRSTGLLPVTYEVLVGTAPTRLSTFGSRLLGTADPLSNLSFATPYYWQVVAADEFGRKAASAVYSFSIAPVADHLIAAPNPFHPGRGATTFLFSMPQAGSALLEIYSLPDSRKVFERRYENLQAGMNTIIYDGRTQGGQLLPNGVYTVRLSKSGAHGHETFRLVSAR